MDFAKSSYSRHEAHWQKSDAAPPTIDDLTDPDQESADQWRHRRMFEPVKAFLHHPEWSWLTVGDGRYGSDSVRIRNMGISNVLPTDIGGALLERAKSSGLVQDFKVENAEAMTFEDTSFDVVFCKESYHHFPRPAVALYEMLRVSRRAVILVEPRDYIIDRGFKRAIGPLGLLRGFSEWLIRKSGMQRRPAAISRRYSLGDEPYYEEAGNYLYTLSSREIEKIALGMNLPAIAVKGLNDCFTPGADKEPADRSSSVFRKMISDIQSEDENFSAGIGSTTLLMAILFLESPDLETRSYLSSSDWLLKDLSQNPYLISGP